jgi:hypothetical protein
MAHNIPELRSSDLFVARESIKPIMSLVEATCLQDRELTLNIGTFTEIPACCKKEFCFINLAEGEYPC